MDQNTNELPPLSDDQLNALIRRCIAHHDLGSMEDVKGVMAFLKENFDGRYEVKLAESLVETTMQEKIKADQMYADTLDELKADLGASVDPSKMDAAPYKAKDLLQSADAGKVAKKEMDSGPSIILPFER